MNVPLADGDRTALLVIDLQLGMFNGERLPPPHAAEAVLSRIVGLLDRARGSGAPVIFVRHAGGSGHLLEKGSPNWAIHPSIAPLPGEVIVDKRAPDSFHDTTLMTELASAGVKRLVVVGAQTEVCLDTTCRRAWTLGFDVVLVSDAHTTWDNDTLSAEQIIRHTNETMAGWFGRAVPAAEIEDFRGEA